MSRWHPLPPEVYSLIRNEPGTVLLHNARPSASSISRLFLAPIATIAVHELPELPLLFEKIESATAQGQRVAGYFAYECGQYFEPTAVLRRNKDEPLAWFGFYDRCIRFDHSAGVFLDPHPFGSEPRGISSPVEFPGKSEIQFSIDEAQFTQRIHQIHTRIRAGDIYQLNFTFPLNAELSESPAELYARLAVAQPVDYAAFLHCRPGHHILSLSPELFFRIDQNGSTRRIATQPMKGTARRGRTTAEDQRISDWLRNDPKNRAENVMIVDLIRNDLGRLCTYGSVHAEKLFQVDRYPSLWQMTSTITGDLRHDVNYEQILRALFPCGSVTGAPKVRAMQLLAEIEPQPRGIYTGAIGYFSSEQSIFNVAIRTLSLEHGKATMGVGSGIVIDSDPKDEFLECRLKTDFLTRPSEPFSLIETMLWNGSFPLLDFHLDRLTDSANHFDIPCDRENIRTSLLLAASAFTASHERKVRLLLDPGGTPHIESETLFRIPDSDPVPVCFATGRTNPSDRFLFHKTTNRALYNSAFAAASAAGFADILFLNTRDEVTEGAISNLFIEKSGRWYTPPLDCGVLPGVYRRHLLETLPDVEEKNLSLNDLKAADSVHICNAIRGLRRVTLKQSANH